MTTENRALISGCEVLQKVNIVTGIFLCWVRHIFFFSFYVCMCMCPYKNWETVDQTLM